jgi:phage terminase Nu1 subunit (DNA packaging protein)
MSANGLSVEVERNGPLVEVTLRIRVDEDMDGILLPYERAAKILGCSERTVQRYVAQGRLDRVLDGRRRHPNGRAIPCVDLEQVIELLRSGRNDGEAEDEQCST